MAENGDGVVDNGRGSEKSGLAEEEVVEKLSGGLKDMDGCSEFEEATEGRECRECVNTEERMLENDDRKVETALQESPLACESENFKETLKLPSPDSNGAMGRNNCLEHSTLSVVEGVQESGAGEGDLRASEVAEYKGPMVEDGEVDRRGDSVEVIYRQEGNVEPKRIGFLVVDANGAVIGSSLHDEDVNGEDNGLSVDRQLEDAKCDKEESCDGKAVFQEKSEDGSDHYVQVSIKTGNTDSDIDEKMRDASSQLPEDVLASISKCNESESHNINPEKEKDTTSEFPEDVSAGVGKRNTYGAVESTAEDTEIAGHTDEEEENFGLMSVGAVDKQFDLPVEVQRNCAREEEESNLNETEEFSGDYEDATSDTSSEEDLVPSIQLRSVEELLHKCVVQSTIATEKSSPATFIGSSSQSSTDFPLPPCHPAGLGSSAPLVEHVSRAIQQSGANGIETSCLSQVLETGKKEKDKVEESVHRENAQSVGFCSSTSIERIDNQRYQPKKLDESSRAEVREKPSVATNKSGMESMADSSSGSSSGIPPPPRPAGLGPTASLLEPGARSQQHARANEIVPPTRSQVTEETINGETGEDNETREKLQMVRVKFLRLANRLGQTPHNAVVAQVLYRLGLAEQIRGSRAGAFSFDRASAMAEQLEASGQDALDFSCTIMVLGKTGVGKSATINSIFDEAKFSTNAFQMGTKNVQAVVGTVQGIKVRVIDTPGLLSSFLDQRHNEKILRSVKSFIKKTPPDIVLYLDRLDMQSRDYGDLPVLRTITDVFGPAIWFNAIVVLTHAASAPPEGPSGTLSYEMFVAQRSHVVQQAIRQAAGDMRLMNPVSLVENHSACRTNRAGQRVLPNGQVWKSHLLLLSFASKILSEANSLLKLQTEPPAKPFGMRSRVPPLPFLLSSLLQSRPQLKLPEEQFGDEDTVNEDLDDSSDSDDECEYDELPPFKCLSKQQISRLNKEQRKAYFDELDYRERLFMKKQLKEEKKRRKLLKKMAASCKQGANEFTENMEEDSGGSATVPVPMPDMALPASFDSDNPTHRYRYLDTSNQWLVRPVFEAHGWDHDVGYEGLNIERLFVVKDNIPISISGQVTKDKKESNHQLECASSIKHGEGKATSLGFDMQTIGKDVAYTLRGETRFSNYRFNKAAAGLSVTLLGDALTAGLKFEDKLMIGKRFKILMNGGAMAGRGNVAYGGSLEATLRDKDYPLGQSLSSLGLSVMDWHGDLAIGCNLQTQFPVGRGTNIIARANLNNRGSGQVSIRVNSSEQFQIALIGLLPLLRNIINNRLLSSQSTQ